MPEAKLWSHRLHFFAHGSTETSERLKFEIYAWEGNRELREAVGQFALRLLKHQHCLLPPGVHAVRGDFGVLQFDGENFTTGASTVSHSSQRVLECLSDGGVVLPETDQ